MAYKSEIQWTNSTWNPWRGCHKISPGCKYCYMYRDNHKFGLDPTQVVKSKSKFNDPLKWKDPGMIFTCSWSDFFIEEADQWRDEAWDIIRRTPHHTYQILTKRPERISQCLPEDWGDGYDNVWLGVSIENQNFIDRLNILSEIPTKIRFISAEPLIGEISMHQCNAETLWNFSNKIHWVIIGGESGSENGKYKYRECFLDWIEYFAYQSKAVGLPVFVKQLGTHLAKELGLKHRHGGDMSQWPEQLRIREFPKINVNEENQDIKRG